MVYELFESTNISTHNSFWTCWINEIQDVFSQEDLTFAIIIRDNGHIYFTTPFPEEHCGVLTRYVKWQTILISFFIYYFSMYLKSIYFYIFVILSFLGCFNVDTKYKAITSCLSLNTVMLKMCTNEDSKLWGHIYHYTR